MYSISNFLEEVKVWESNKSHLTNEERKEFQNSINFKHQIPSSEEVEKIIKSLFREFRPENAKSTPSQIKWNIDEKKLLIWLVYYYLKLRSKELDNLVIFSQLLT